MPGRDVSDARVRSARGPRDTPCFWRARKACSRHSRLQYRRLHRLCSSSTLAHITHTRSSNISSPRVLPLSANDSWISSVSVSSNSQAITTVSRGCVSFGYKVPTSRPGRMDRTDQALSRRSVHPIGSAITSCPRRCPHSGVDRVFVIRQIHRRQ